MRVLLVDDEKDFVSVLSERLKLRGIEADFFYSAIEAIEAFKKDSGYNVIVLDLKMPDMDGVTAFTIFKEIAPLVEIIILSGLIEPGQELALIDKSAAAFLYKPIEIKELISKIKETILKKHC
ncbi:MAG: response regulator [Nitrospirae bacterium YQR-1]